MQNADSASIHLLEAARAGDRAALEQLLQRHQAQIYRFGLRMCRDAADAEDVLQETLIALARGVRDFRGASSLSTWLYAVARSFCIKKRRRSRHAPTEVSLQAAPAAESEAVPDSGPAADELLARKQVERALEAAVRSLEPMYREVLVLRDIEGLTAPEVAEVLGIGVTAVKSRLHRARTTVRERVAPLLGIVPEGPGSAPTGCPDVVTLFSRHLEGEISADLCARMERHLQGCPRCRGACDSLRETLALCRTAPHDIDVPPTVQRMVQQALRQALGAMVLGPG